MSGSSLHLLVLKSSMTSSNQLRKMSLAGILPVAVVRLHVGDLHAVGWGEGP